MPLSAIFLIIIGLCVSSGFFVSLYKTYKTIKLSSDSYKSKVIVIEYNGNYKQKENAVFNKYLYVTESKMVETTPIKNKKRSSLKDILIAENEIYEPYYCQ